ncbi:uncharacterized protein DFL_006651 [Arthrobotrys flagrans]|uniref:Uncharacterized protein n=1 Tax=Arthrobotrys flagrans TaxID=97331 RepID=A0A436ZTH9_ARTFL|nr:hypothetical protein DFL_006651 [Arthrobotrys flagrans]
MAWNHDQDVAVAPRKPSMTRVEDIAVLKLVSPLAVGKPVAPISRKREWIDNENLGQYQTTILSFNTELKSHDVKITTCGWLRTKNWCYGSEFETNVNNSRPNPHIHHKFIRHGRRDTIGYSIACTDGSSGGIVMIIGDFIGVHQGAIYDEYLGPQGCELKITSDSLSRAIALDLPEVNNLMRTNVFQHFNSEELRFAWKECLVDLEADYSQLDAPELE